MIKEITEVNFPSYATLDEATVTENAMGLRTITATVKIDGDVVPDFSYDWVVEYDGEKYIHPLRKPQGAVENTTLYASYDLTFQHWAEYQLKRYFFAEMAEVGADLLIPDKFNASIAVNLENFVIAFNNVLQYYYGDSITMDLRSATYSEETIFVSINNTKVWDVLAKVYELFGVTWKLERAGEDRYIIKVGYPSDEISHVFRYGFDGGLLKVERQVQSSDISNILRGRGGDKNIPYRYFKNTDSDNPSFARDPDYIPELANVYFSELRDINFRYYVQGWKDKHYAYNTATGGINENPLDHLLGVRRYETGLHWAYDEGFNATKFDPVEWVKDDKSIGEYGELWNVLDDNEDIYPTIQGVEVFPYGRVDQVVDVEQIESDDVEQAAESESLMYNLEGQSKSFASFKGKDIHFIRETVKYENVKFTVGDAQHTGGAYVLYDTQAVGRCPTFVRGTGRTKDVTVTNVATPVKRCYDFNTGQSVNISQLENGHTYCPIVDWNIQAEIVDGGRDDSAVVTTSVTNVKWGYSAEEGEKWYNSFDIWVKNIWSTSPNSGETDEKYAERVWKPILGDKDEGEAKVVFSSGWLSTSEDYEFPILAYAFDTSKTYKGVRSHWRLTLKKCDADLETLNLYVPSTQRQGNAGDYFFFTGIDMPHQYVLWAEERLNAYKENTLAEVSDIKPTWNITLDKIRIQELQGFETDTLISQIKTGGLFRLQDDRLLPAEEGQAYDTFYVKSKVVKFGKGIYPDLEVTLSDDIKPSQGTISTITGEVSALQAQVGSLSNIEQVMRYFGDKVYLRKDGIADESRSATSFLNLVKSGDFTQGRLGGKGWAVYRDAQGNAVMETDKIVVRESLEVTELVVHQTEYVGGSRIESAASITCSHVEPVNADGDDWVVVLDGSYPRAYKCYFDTKQGTLKNLFMVDDVAYSHAFDEQLVSLSYYKRRVIDKGTDFIVLSNSVSAGQSGVTEVDGTGVPMAGDVIIHYGSYTNTDRQYVKVSDVIGGGYERFVEGLNSVSASGKEYFFVGKAIDKNGVLQAYRMFVGDKDGQYLEWLDGKLHIKGTLSVESNVTDGEDSQTLSEYLGQGDYLRGALTQSTTITGGLLLTSLIALGESNESEQTQTTWSGVSGIYDEEKQEQSIAAWYGGDMVDKDSEEGETAPRPAKTLFRMDGSGYLASGGVAWESDGTLKVQKAEMQDVIIRGSSRNEFKYVWDSFDTKYGDCAVMQGDGPYSTKIYSIPWDVENVGRRLVITNFFWDNTRSQGPMCINAPDGKYFFYDGVRKKRLYAFRQVVELLGYGTKTEFYGWIVMNIQGAYTDNMYGSNLKAVAVGKVIGTNTGASIGYKNINQENMSVERKDKGYYRVTFPDTWFGSKNDYLVWLQGYGYAYGHSSGTSYMVKASMLSQTETYFDVVLSDDATANDGSFTFMIINMDTWNNWNSWGA